jgi:transposase-like protein
MERNIEQRKQYEEPFKQAAAHFFYNSGRSLEAVSAELGLDPGDLRTWKRKYPSAAPLRTAPLAPSDPVRRLQAENQALRAEILRMKVQWDILKTTLGILSGGASPQQESV